MIDMVTYGIFTKPQHVEKIVNYLNIWSDVSYLISTNRWETEAFEFDVGISYCFPWIIDLNTPKNKNRIWYNYHPGPLPRYGNLGNYAKGIKDDVKRWGVTLHTITMDIDKGPILQRKSFDLASYPTNTAELGDISHYYLYQLFKQTINYLQFKPRDMVEFGKIKIKHAKDVIIPLAIDEFNDLEEKKI